MRKGMEQIERREFIKYSAGLPLILLSGSALVRSDSAGATRLNLVTRSVTFRVSANDASPASKAQADFIADGIGDEEEINLAITLLPTTGNQVGGEVSLSEGNFNLTGSIILKDGLKLIGQGYTATYINKYADVPMVASTTSMSSIVLKGFTLDGRRVVGGFMTSPGISLTGPRFTVIEDVWVRKQGGWGIYIEGTAQNAGYEITLNRVIAIDNGDGSTTGGIRLNSNPYLEQIRLIDSSLTEHGYTALWATDVNLLRVSRLHVEQASNNYHAIEFDRTRRSYIEGSYITGGNIGIYFYDTSHSNALNNFVKGTASRAIRLYSAEYSQVIGNHDEDGKGIIAMNGGAYNILMGNTALPGGWGIMSDEATSIVVNNIGQ